MIINDLFFQVKNLVSKNTFNEIIIYIKKLDNSDFLLTDFITKKETKLFNKIIKKLEKNIPLAHIIKKHFFYENNFFINKNVLIPRIETELLIEETLKYDLNNKTVFDICCGSGCIGISLKLKIPSINLVLSDISPKALRVCKTNVKQFKINNTLIKKADFLNIFLYTSYIPDFIIINPPYIDINDTYISKQTKAHEPHLALFAKEDGLFFFNLLFEKLSFLFSLNKKLIIICEFGFMQKNLIQEIFEKNSFKCKITFRKDYSNNWRYFIITNNTDIL